MINILYVSSLASRKVFDDISTKTKGNPGIAAQKFNRLVVLGLKNNNCSVTALSSLPLTRSIEHRLLSSRKKEKEDGITFRYIPFLGISFVKQLFTLVWSFLFTLSWHNTGREKKALICDALTLSASMGALMACKIRGIDTIAIVTDIRGQMVGGDKRMSLKMFLAKFFFDHYISSFNYYVLLTEQMNTLVNPHNRKYIVMEALCEKGLDVLENKSRREKKSHAILYAGGLYEKYGVKMLIDAVHSMDNKDIQLILFGDGDCVPYISELNKVDSRIDFRGVCSNDEVVKEEMRATLLVNPRFSSETFSAYSFPSKNMEYMVTGTPVLTTNLPGMPSEYLDFVFTFGEETIDGYANTIEMVLQLPEAKLMEMGLRARDFVLKEKNNVIQANRILSLLA